MKTMTAVVLAAMAAGGVAQAGGIDRSKLSYGILYEEGNYAEIGLSHAAPNVSGTYGVPLGGGSTGDMAGDYSSLSFAYKHQFSDKLQFGLFVNQPYGADASYTNGPYTGLNATWESRQIAGVLRYEVSPGISVLGGLRYVRSEAEIEIPSLLVPPAPTPYAASGSTSDIGYIVGAAYERPEIALRVALTYESKISHSFPTRENWPFVLGTINTTTDIEIPQSLVLDFQSGVAQDTLVFGSIRWSEWSKWSVRPPGFDGITGQEITGFDNDVITWQLGVGRRLNESFSVFARLGYEKANGGISSRLSPTDGSRSIGVGGTYTTDNVKITGGIEYVELGDAVDGSGTRFRNNDALGFGVTVGFRF